MDRYSDRVPVRTKGSGTQYDGRVLNEPLRSLKTVNDVPVETPDLKHGDNVTVAFEGKIFSGVIDLESRPTTPPPVSPRQDFQTISPGRSPPVSTAEVSQPYRDLVPCEPKPKVRKKRLKRKQVSWLKNVAAFYYYETVFFLF